MIETKKVKKERYLMRKVNTIYTFSITNIFFFQTGQATEKKK